MDEQPTPYEVTLEIDPPYAGEVDGALLERVAQRALAHVGVEGPADLSVWITNESELHTLNRTYRGVDKSTDVLSFGEDENDTSFVLAPEATRHVGDIAISFPHAVRQAESFGHPHNHELAFLLTHGILHLLGHDHEEAGEEAEMHRQEDASGRRPLKTRLIPCTRPMPHASSAPACVGSAHSAGPPASYAPSAMPSSVSCS
jgi:probable rRNA maturation factor